jgi:hypothetical protein
MSDYDLINGEILTVAVTVDEETVIANINTAARGPAGEAGAAGAAGPNTLTTATTTNLTGFISGNGTNISSATAAASAATANTLVLRDANGGASFAGVTLSGINTNSGSYSQVGGANFNVATTTAANLTATGSGTVIVSGAGGTTISGGTLTFSPSGFAYGAGAASAHRTALGAAPANIPITTESTTTRTLAAGDIGTKIRVTNATSCDLTIPASLGVAGAAIIVRRATGAGAISFTLGVGVTVNNSGVAAITAGQEFAIVAVGANEWDFV